MSSGGHGKSRTYRCFNDCQELGCPGHQASVVYTEDWVAVNDGFGIEKLYDPRAWKTLVALDREARREGE